MSDIINDMFISNNMILEMVAVNGSISNDYDVPIDPRINVDAITNDDSDPKFVNVEVIRSGISKGNNRRYSNSVVDSINNMIPGVQGFLGHPDPSKYGFEFREPQCIFVGSKVDIMEDGIHRIIAKAYLFKTSPLREWIPKSIAAKNPMTVSINGSGDIIRGTNDTIDVIRLNILQSIDWANPGTEGMGTSQAISIVSEQNQNIGGDNIMADVIATKEVIGNVSVTELKAYNPTILGKILESATLTELQNSNPSLVNEIKESAKITELALDIGGESKTIKITELQSILAGYEDTISKLNKDIEDAKVIEMIASKVSELVPADICEMVKPRIVGRTESEIVDSINKEIAFITEIRGSTTGINPPVGAYKPHADADVRDAVANMFKPTATK